MNNNPDDNAPTSQGQPSFFDFGQTPTSAPQQSVFSGSGMSNAFPPSSAPAASLFTSGPPFGIQSSGSAFGMQTAPVFGGGASSGLPFGQFGVAQSSLGATTPTLSGFSQSNTGTSLQSTTPSFGAGTAFGAVQPSTTSSFFTLNQAAPTTSFGGSAQRSLFGETPVSTPMGFGGSFGSSFGASMTGSISGAGSGLTGLSQTTTPSFLSSQQNTSISSFTPSAQSSGSSFLTSQTGSLFGSGISGMQSGGSLFSSTMAAPASSAAFQAQTTPSVFQSASSGGFAFGPTPSSPLMSTPQAPAFNLGATTGSSFLAEANTFFNTTSQFGSFSAATAPSAPPISAAPNPFMTGTSSSPPLPGRTAVMMTGSTATRPFPNLQPTLTPPSGISPAVSLAAATPIPSVSSPQTVPSTTFTPFQPPRSSEIQPDTTPAMTPAQSSPVASTPSTTTPVTTQMNLFPSPTSAASTSPPASTAVSVAAQGAVQPVVSGATGAMTVPLRGPEIGAVLHVALPAGHKMEDDFRFIAERIAIRDVQIVHRGGELKKVTQEFQDLVRRQKYGEQQLQRLEALIAQTPKVTKVFMERLKESMHGQGVALVHMFENMYSGLTSSDSILSELEKIMEEIFDNRTRKVPTEGGTGAGILSTLEVEQLMVTLKDLEDRRAKLAETLKSM